jgi:hypothetical protein
MFYGTHETNGTHALRTTAIALLNLSFACDLGRLKAFRLKSFNLW